MTSPEVEAKVDCGVNGEDSGKIASVAEAGRYPRSLSPPRCRAKDAVYFINGRNPRFPCITIYLSHFHSLTASTLLDILSGVGACA